MKSVQFQEVGMENYGPYIDPMLLTFENDKLTLITGPNGIGKTMSIDAIPFTLFGTTSKGAKGDDVVNNVVGKNCKTWVKFKVDDIQYLVTRYHQYTKFGNTVVINENGVDIKQGHKECLPFIERIVCPQKAFMNALMFGQKVKDFFTDLPDAQKKDIFRKVLDLEMFLVYYKHADQALKEIIEKRAEKEQRNMINAGLLQDTKEQIQLLKQAKIEFGKQKEERIKEKKKAIEESARLLSHWRKSVDELKTKDMNLEETISALATIEKTIQDLSKTFEMKLNDLTQQKIAKINELEGRAEKARFECRSKYADKLSDIQSKRFDAKENLSKELATLQNTIHKHRVQISRGVSKCEMRTEKINEINDHVINSDISECPTCLQEVSFSTKELLEEKIESYKKEIELIEQKVTDLENEITTIELEMKKLKDQTDSIVSQLTSEENAIKRVQQDEYELITIKLTSVLTAVETLSRQEEKAIEEEEIKTTTDILKEKEVLIERKKIQQANIEELKIAEENSKNIEKNIDHLEKNIQDISASEYDESQLNNYLKKEREYQQALIKGSQDLKEFDKLQDVASFWKTAFSSSGIPSMLIDEAVPYMNERVEHYLDMLTNGRYVVSFDTLAETKAGEFRDKISVHVLDTQTRANSRVQLSGGQTRIIDIAIILTLGDLLSSIQNISFNILLFDEIFDALDEQNIQYVSKVLSKIKIGKSIYIISHQHQDHLESDQVLAFS
jgi:DNA repair exonuclease SbcCD ATPase subunit